MTKRFEVFTAIEEVEVFWVMRPFSVTGSTNVSKDQVASIFRSSETLVSYRNTTRRHNQADLNLNIQGCNQKFPDWLPANGTALCH